MVKNLHPPKPKLVVRVGVTGHRPNRLQSASMDMLQQRIGEVLATIKDMVKLIRQEATAYYADTPPVLRLISPLAEGADRIVAQEAINIGCELQCPLPFEQKQYEKDFVLAESLTEFQNLLNQATAVLELDGQVIDKDSAYHAVGKMVLNQCDILIAVWDGNEASGAGGTAQIVEEAHTNMIPTIWIKASNPHEISLTYSRDDWEATVRNHLERILIPMHLSVVSNESSGLYKESSAMMETFFNEKQRKFNGGFPYKMFRDFIGDGKLKLPQLGLKDFEEASQAEWQMEVWDKSIAYPSAMVQQMEDGFMKYYAWADKLADYYADLYRTSFLTTYICSGFAVLFALFSYALQSSHAIWPILSEVLIIFLIVLVTYLANRYKWHKRWIDYRMFAELLRPMRFLAPLGQVTASFRVPAHASADDVSISWVNWYFRAVLREAGLINMKIDSNYLAAYRNILKEGEIKGQKDFHFNNQHRYHRICHRLHCTGTTLFMITFIAAFSHLFYHGAYSHWLTVISAVCPAFGAAFVGILFQGEFERLEQRSQAMYNKLEQLYKVDDGMEEYFRSLQELALDTADCMLTEVLDWHHMFMVRRLNLPG